MLCFVSAAGITIAVTQDADASKKSCARNCIDWYCGMESNEQSRLDEHELREHIRRISCLKQNKRTRCWLHLTLIVLIIVDLFVYVFFSTGSDFGLLRGDHKSTSSLFTNRSFWLLSVEVVCSYCVWSSRRHCHDAVIVVVAWSRRLVSTRQSVHPLDVKGFNCEI